MLCASWSLEFFKFDLNMASLNKDSSQKDILDEKPTHLLWMWSQMMYVWADQRHNDGFDSDVDKYSANDYT